MDAMNALHQVSARPVRPDQRVAAIDVLRGVALFGVLTVNLLTVFRISIFQQFLPPALKSSSLDRAVDWIVSVGLELKAFALFSLLFGVGLAIQFERLASNEMRSMLLFRRMLALFAIGVFHLCFVWNGDILTHYALVGLIILPFLYASKRVLIAACAVALLFYAAIPIWFPDLLYWPDEAGLRQHVQEATYVYAHGTWSEVTRFSMSEVPLYASLLLAVTPRTIALFLLGVLAWRLGVLRNPARHRRVLIGTAVVGVVLGLGMTVLAVPTAGALAPLFSALMSFSSVLLAIGYGAAVIAFYSFTRSGRVLALFGPVGRMAFTNYLVQSLVLGWIFFGYGLGMFGRLSSSQAIVLGMILYFCQVIVSQWWLQRFRFGPMEWLWRTLMYGTRQPWRI